MPNGSATNTITDLLTAAGLSSGISLLVSLIVCGIIGISLKLWTESKLQTQITENETELKKIQAELDKTTHIHRVQFEKEFQIYETIWEKLEKLEHSTFHYIYNTNEERFAEKSSDFHDALDEFRICYKKNQPFYPEKIYNVLNEVYKFALESGQNKNKNRSDYKEEDYFSIRKNTVKSLRLIRERISSIQIVK